MKPMATRMSATFSVCARGMPKRSLRRAAIMMPARTPTATKRPKVRIVSGPMLNDGNVQ